MAEKSGPKKATPEFLRLLEESRSLKTGPYRMTNASIEKERVRFDAGQELIKRGKIEAARRVAWWPRNEDPPTKHWSRVPHAPCSCRRQAADGTLGLCGYCGGTTNETPSAIPRS